MDVFFVISGYLITGIILRENQAKTFTLQNFYVRRCRRILPALITVLLGTWIIGKVALTPNDFRMLGKHILGGSTFTSNIMLWGESGYFDFAATRKPLLHLWSLGVEEQFYILWPPLLMLAFWRGWKPVSLMAGVVGASFIAASVMMPIDETAAFYLLPFRMWELMVGALLVAAQQAATPGQTAGGTKDRSANARAVAGVALIVAASALYQAGSAARLWWIVAAVAGTAAVISAPSAWVNRHFLSRRTMVLVGLISYPLYLWHWPLLSTVRLLGGQATMVDLGLLKAATVGVSFVLAWLTWRAIELPAQRFASAPPAQKSKRNTLVLQLSSATLLAMALVGWRAWSPKRDVAPTTADGEPLRDGARLFRGAVFHRVSAADSVVLLIGDSHANALRPGILFEARKRGFGLSHVGLYGCPGVPLRLRLWGSADLHAQCQALVDSTLSFFLRDSAIKVVIFTAREALYTTGSDGSNTFPGADIASVPKVIRTRALTQGYAAALRRVEAAGKRAVMVLDVPELDFDPNYCANQVIPSSERATCATPRAFAESRQGGFRDVASRLQRDHPRLVVFDPYPLLCDARQCHAMRNGVPLYSDANHLSDEGSKLVAAALDSLVFPRRASISPR